MQLVHDVQLRYFEFWSGARQRADHLSYEQLDRIEFELEMLYPDGMSDTDVNDLFWFEEDFIAQLLGYEDWEALEADEDDDEED